MLSVELIKRLAAPLEKINFMIIVKSAADDGGLSAD